MKTAHRDDGRPRARRRPKRRPWLALAAILVPLAAAAVLALVRGLP
ncbi:hypothetical protein PJ900_17400 [Tistrella mobilis]|nr:hypothetical protein [Tistrella mobilis]